MVDFLRFIASLMIIWCHTSIIRPSANNPMPDGRLFHFTSSAIFVEFFLLLMGFFTYKHFQNKNLESNSIDNKIKDSFLYTFKKFKEYLPYTISAIILVYIVIGLNTNFQSTQSVLDFIKTFPMEMLFISSQTSGTKLGPIWYLSATFIVLPLFCFISQWKNKNLLPLFGVPLALVFYSQIMGFSGSGFYALVRVFVGLVTGALIYRASLILSKIRLTNLSKILLSILEPLLFVISIIVLYPNDIHLMDDRVNIVLEMLLFVTCLTLLMSGQTISSKIKVKSFSFLGKLSLPLYLYHYVVVEFIWRFIGDYSISTKIILLYAVTFIISIFSYCAVELAKIRLQSPRDKFIKNKN